MYQIIVFLFYMYIATVKPVSVISAKSIKHMSRCEVSLHTNCISSKEIEKKLVEECNPSPMLKCLEEHLKKEICVKKDPVTIPTIEIVIKEITKRFKRNKRCGNKAFFLNVKQHFLIQGQGIERYTGINAVDFSGSGDIPDDTEGPDEPSDGTIGETEDGNKIKEREEEKKRDDISNFWLENSRIIMKAKKNVQARVFFDDPSQYRNTRKTDTSQKLSRVKNAWEKLQFEYKKWYRNSKYYT